MDQYFIGLMSGTSLDGVDAALVKFVDDQSVEVVASHTYPIPESLGKTMRSVITEQISCDLILLGSLDHQFGELFAEVVNKFLQENSISKDQIVAIGCHGITIIHQPDIQHPFTLQIGDANRIAARTGITTVADFRRRDMAYGGQGAPLAPGFHAEFFSSPDEKRVVANIGGISNISVLNPGHEVIGFDTGPGNGLLDAWHQQHHGESFDHNGQWAASGTVNKELMTLLLEDDYFSRLPPKSTGKEKFNLAWVTGHLLGMNPPPEPVDVQSTLAEITAKTIADGVLRHTSDSKACIVCGGGAHNFDLMQRLQRYLPNMAVASTQQIGISPDDVEAAAFAWFAKCTLENRPSNIPNVTGASQRTILGAIYPA